MGRVYVTIFTSHYAGLKGIVVKHWVLLDLANFWWAKGPEGAPVLRSNDKVGEVVREILLDFEKSVAYELSTISEPGDLQEEGESFNVTFEKIHSTQARWVVQHFELREELLLSNVEKVIPAYASFLERFKKHIEGNLSKWLSNTWVLLDPTYFLWAKGPEGAPVLCSSDKISEVVRAILSDFRKSVAYEMSTISGARGTIHFLTKGNLRRRLRSFNATFEQIRSTQARWVVQHLELR
ncbi:hypothetical protein LguiA_033378 [Lonicera macranthoides]